MGFFRVDWICVGNRIVTEWTGELCGFIAGIRSTLNVLEVFMGLWMYWRYSRYSGCIGYIHGTLNVFRDSRYSGCIGYNCITLNVL